MSKRKCEQRRLAEKCFEDKDLLRKLDKLPRDASNFWPRDNQMAACALKPISLVKNNALNMGIAYTHKERQLYSIHGLLPFAVFPIEKQMEICAQYFATLKSRFQRYMFLADMELQNRQLFLALLCDPSTDYMDAFNSTEYDYVVTNLCFLNARSMFITIKDRGHIYETLRNWPYKHSVRFVVVSSGERVLSLGDHGINSSQVIFYKPYQFMVFGGIDPNICLPVMLDVGTNNEELLANPAYLGYRQRRVPEREFDEFFEEFVLAVIRLYGPLTFIQAKNFTSRISTRQLAKYRKLQCYMDIDLQCLGGCGLAGVLGANKINKTNYTANLMLFYGDQPFLIGMASLCIAYYKRMGLDEDAARKRVWFCDVKGLVVSGPCGHKVAEELEEFKQRYEPIPTLVEAIQKLKPNVLVGCCGEKDAFTKEVIKAMEQSTEHPIIFSMSNPAIHTECSANDAFVYTKGRCIFISPFSQPPLKYANKWYQPGNCTIHYMMPGVTLGALLAGMTTIPDETFLVAAERLSSLIWPIDIVMRNVYPPLKKRRCVSLQIADAVFTHAYRRRLATLWPEPSNAMHYIKSQVYKPEYQNILPSHYCTQSQNIGTGESLTYYQLPI